MLYIIFPLIFFNLNSVKETGIFYQFICIYFMPSTFILGLVAVLILVFALKKDIINEKHAWVVFICAVLGIFAVAAYFLAIFLAPRV
jgi:hypothetical protein